MSKKTDVLIVNPPIYSRRQTKFDMPVRPRPPLDLLYLQAMLKKHYRSRFWDAQATGKNVEDVVNYVHQVKPSILILTTTPLDRWECPNLFIDSIFAIINKAAKLKVKTILYGTHGTVTPEWIFKKAKVDYLIRGEPELPVEQLVGRIMGNKSGKFVKGVCYREKGGKKVVCNPLPHPIKDLDILPYPAYEDADFGLYRYTTDDIPSPFTIMLASRGCPFACTFCLKEMMAALYRIRKPEKIVDEMLLLQNKFGIKGIYFQDWEFVINKEHVKTLCDLMIKRGVKVNWGCNARVSDFNLELMKLMKKAGCVRINIGFESGSQRMLDLIRKMIKVEQIEAAVKICRALGIHLGMYTLINLPGENEESLRETAKFLVKHGLEDNFWWSYPIPYLGTQMNKEHGLVNKTWPQLSKLAGMNRVTFSPEEARYFLTRAVWQKKYGKYYFLNPLFTEVVWRQIKDVYFAKFARIWPFSQAVLPPLVKRKYVQ